MTETSIRRPVILVNEAAVGLFLSTPDSFENAEVIVAGSSQVRLALSDLTIPGARLILTDFRQTASLGALHGIVQARGGVDDLILAGDGASSEAMFSMMCTILTLMPALRRPSRARIILAVNKGCATSSLETFVKRVEPRLARDGISILLQISDVAREGTTVH